MKKVVISLVTLSSIVLLAACGQSKTETQTSASSSKAKTSQTSPSAKSKSSSTSANSSTASSDESNSVAASSSESTAAPASSGVSAAQKEAEKPVAKDVTSFASFAGTWANDRGETVTVNPDGSVVTTTADGNSYNMALWFNQDFQGVGSYTIHAPGASAGSAGLLYIPAGVTNPHIGTTDSKETLLIGQDVSADEHPYYRQ